MPGLKSRKGCQMKIDNIVRWQKTIFIRLKLSNCRFLGLISKIPCCNWG